MLLAIPRCGYRLFRLNVHLVCGIVTILVMRRRSGTTWYSLRLGQRLIREWMAKTCDIVGLQVSVEGTSPRQGGQLFVANHVSWLDIIAIASVSDCKFLSKDTVRFWPVIGWLTKSVGTLFIRRRQRRDFYLSLKRLQQQLQSGNSICIFPEGTTSDGRDVLPFHSGLLQAAIQARSLVQPLLLQYQDARGNWQRHAPYYGKDLFFIHLLVLLAKPSTSLKVIFLPGVQSSSIEYRQVLADRLRYMLQVQLKNDTPIEPEAVLAKAS